MEPRKQAIISALRQFIAQRSGIEYGNYGDVKAFRAEQRSIARDKREALTLMRAVELSDSITADDLLKAAQSAFSGRLTIRMPGIQPGGTENFVIVVDYCTGQYFPTEYRRAVCAVLASALWYFTREQCMPTDGSPNYREVAESSEYKRGGHWLSAGGWLRSYFRDQFGRGIQARWFN